MRMLIPLWLVMGICHWQASVICICHLTKNEYRDDQCSPLSTADSGDYLYQTSVMCLYLLRRSTGVMLLPLEQTHWFKRDFFVKEDFQLSMSKVTNSAYSCRWAVTGLLWISKLHLFRPRICNMNPNFHSLCICSHLIFQSEFSYSFSILCAHLSYMETFSGKYPGWNSKREIKTCAVNPNSGCHCRLLQTYLMNEYFWIVFTTLLYQSSIAYFILLDLFYIFMSAVTTFPHYFSLPGLPVTLNVKRLFYGMKISHLRLNWLLLTKEIFPVNHASCEKEQY